MLADWGTDQMYIWITQLEDVHVILTFLAGVVESDTTVVDLSSSELWVVVVDLNAEGLETCGSKRCANIGRQLLWETTRTPEVGQLVGRGKLTRPHRVPWLFGRMH